MVPPPPPHLFILCFMEQPSRHIFVHEVTPWHLHDFIFKLTAAAGNDSNATHPEHTLYGRQWEPWDFI